MGAIRIKNYIIPRVTDVSCEAGRRFPCIINPDSALNVINIGKGTALFAKIDDPDYIYVIGDDNIELSRFLSCVENDIICKVKLYRGNEKVLCGTSSEILDTQSDYLDYRVKKTSVNTKSQTGETIEIWVIPPVKPDDMLVADFVDMVSKQTEVNIYYQNNSVCFSGQTSDISEQSDMFVARVHSVSIEDGIFKLIIDNPQSEFDDLLETTDYDGTSEILD